MNRLWLLRLILLPVLLPGLSLAETPLRVAATTPNMAMLARTVGGSAVTVQTLAPGDRDVHYLEARPSMLAHLRRADLVVAVGADLEAGWLPVALQRAANPAIQPGRSGYLALAEHLDLLAADQPADRALGDVHPLGNPHFYYDPQRMALAAQLLATRLGELRPETAADFQQRADAFAQLINSQLPHWQTRSAQAPGAVLYHKNAVYLLERFQIPVLAYIEPLPGIPPSGRHLRHLVQQLRSRQGVILHLVFEPARGPAFLSRQLGWPVHVMHGEVAPDGSAEDYVALIDGWITALEPR